MEDIVDSYSEANQDATASLWNTHPSADTTWSAEGQSFTGNGQKLHSCKFYIAVAVGTPGNLIARLYAHTGTFGTSSKPTGAALDSSNPVAAGGLGGSYVLVEFTGFSGYTLVNGAKYCIAIEGYDGTWDIDNYINAGSDKSSPSHAGNRFGYHDSAWHIETTRDICFYVYGITPPAFQPWAIIM